MEIDIDEGNKPYKNKSFINRLIQICNVWNFSIKNSSSKEVSFKIDSWKIECSKIDDLKVDRSKIERDILRYNCEDDIFLEKYYSIYL